MKIKSTILFLIFATTAFAGAYHPKLVGFQCTQTDGTLWSCSLTNVENPTQIGTGSNAIGSHSCAFLGHTYQLDWLHNLLIEDGSIEISNGVEVVVGGSVVGDLLWLDAGWVLDLQRHYGFCIDWQGYGWIMSSDSDADNQTFLWQLDLATGYVKYIDYVGVNPLFPVSGMVPLQ